MELSWVYKQWTYYKYVIQDSSQTSTMCRAFHIKVVSTLETRVSYFFWQTFSAYRIKLLGGVNLIYSYKTWAILLSFAGV